MRRIKSYKLFESNIDDIEEIIYNCEDIMMELQDDGFRIIASSSTILSKIYNPLNKSYRGFRITCKIAREFAHRWGKYRVIDVYDRLNDYLSGVGFEEVSRSLGDVSKFPVVDGMYEASIIFDEK